MAVQAQHPFNSISMQNNIWDDNHAQYQPQLGDNSVDCHQNLACGRMFNRGTAFSDPDSELTCNISGNCKRNRDFNIVETGAIQPFMHDFTSLHDDPVPASMKINQDIDSYFPSRSLTHEDIIRYENQKLCVMLDELRKRQCMSLSGMIEQKAMKILREKETELAELLKVNTELEEKVKRMSLENQMWFNVAKNSEATACSLRLSLEQMLQENATVNQRVEGFGETDGLTDEVQSTCNGDERRTMMQQQQMLCKLCGVCDVSFLVFPCRHLCLCASCEAEAFSCPVCNAIKIGALQVFLS